MMSKLSYLFLADTPVQTINCVSIALKGVQLERDERHDLVIYGQFSNAQEMYEFALSSEAFENVYLYQGVSSFRRWGQRKALLDVFFGNQCLAAIPEFVKNTSYAAMLFSCPTAISYDLFRSVRTNNPEADVYLYEDGTGTYTGSIFQGLIYPGDTPRDISNRPLVNVAKSLLRRVSSDYQPYPIKRLFVKCPELLNSSYGLDITEFKLQRAVLASRFLDASGVSEKLASVQLLFLEPPEVADNFVDSLDIEQFIHDAGFDIAVRRHPRTLTSCHSKSFVDCTGGLWEAICGAINDSSIVLVGTVSSSMMAPVVGYGLYPKIIILDYMDSLKQDTSTTGLIVDMILTLYKGKENFVFVPKTKDELLASLHKTGLAANAQMGTSRGGDGD